jgi:hypothetical protein
MQTWRNKEQVRCKNENTTQQEEKRKKKLVCFLLGDSLVYDIYIPHTNSPMKMELTLF